MDNREEIERLAAFYRDRGYQVTVSPRPDELPEFARTFRVEIAARRGSEGVLVSVKKNRDEVAADPDVPRYAEVTGAQPGWRFDLIVLESEPTRSREIGAAQDSSVADIRNALAEAEQMVQMGFARPAVVAAWSALEAAMRARLRAAGEESASGVTPRSMINELYSSGAISFDEFARLEELSQVRSRIVHGFAAPVFDAGVVQFMAILARRLLEEASFEKQSA